MGEFVSVRSASSAIARALLALTLATALNGKDAFSQSLNDTATTYELGDYISGIDLLRAQAEYGVAHAQHIIGFMYERGLGVPQDYAAAAKWYRLAADQNFAGAQFKLGRLYSLGRGVPQDYGEAAVWYAKA